RQWFFLYSAMQQEARVHHDQEYRSRLYFVGVKKGDVNYSAGPRSDRHRGVRQRVRIGDPEENAGLIRVPVYLENAGQIESLQLSLINQNSSPWIAVESGRMSISPEDYRMTDDELDVVWIQQRSLESARSSLTRPDFYLVFDAS